MYNDLDTSTTSHSCYIARFLSTSSDKGCSYNKSPVDNASERSLEMTRSFHAPKSSRSLGPKHSDSKGSLPKNVVVRKSAKPRGAGGTNFLIIARFTNGLRGGGVMPVGHFSLPEQFFFKASQSCFFIISSEAMNSARFVDNLKLIKMWEYNTYLPNTYVQAPVLSDDCRWLRKEQMKW